MRLIDDWRRAWRLLSINVSAILAACGAYWVTLTDQQQEQMLLAIGVQPQKAPGYVLMVSGVIFIVSRLVSFRKR